MTVALPKQAAYGLARAAGARVGNTLTGDILVNYPPFSDSSALSGREVIYSHRKLGNPPRGLLPRPMAALYTDLVGFAEVRLGVTITKVDGSS